jgi:hypothetical protein
MGFCNHTHERQVASTQGEDCSSEEGHTEAVTNQVRLPVIFLLIGVDFVRDHALV